MKTKNAQMRAEGYAARLGNARLRARRSCSAASDALFLTEYSRQDEVIERRQ